MLSNSATLDSRLSVRTVNWRAVDFQLARRQLDVVAPQRALDVVDRQVARRHRPPVEPDPDREAALAEDLDLRDALEGRQPVDDEALDVVGDLGRRSSGRW